MGGKSSDTQVGIDNISFYNKNYILPTNLPVYLSQAQLTTLPWRREDPTSGTGSNPKENTLKDSPESNSGPCPKDE